MITDLQVAQAFSDLKGVCGGQKEDYFGLIYLENEHQLARDKAVNQVTFGGNDYGLDGYHFDVARRTLFLFQFKYTKAYGQFKGSMQRLISEGMNRIFNTPNIDHDKNQIFVQMRSCIIENRHLIEQVCFRFVFLGDPVEAEKSQALDKLKEDLEAKRYLVEQFFAPRDISFIVDYRSSSGKVAGLTVSHKLEKFEIEASKRIETHGPEGERLISFFVPLMKLHHMHKAIGSRFFDRNVRYGLGSSKSVNRAVVKTLKSIVIDRNLSASTFAFNHNGVTIFADNVDVESDKVVLHSPRMLNGAQTVTTFAGFLNDNKDNANIEANRAELDSILVLCKVIYHANDEFASAVTINNNRQNPVEPWNLHANDMIQLELQDKLSEELNIYYERQENAFAQLSPEELDELGIKADARTIQMLKLCQTFVVTDGSISRISQMRRIFEDEKTYKQVFAKDRLQAKSTHMLLCYKVERKLRRCMDEIACKGEKYHVAYQARLLIWAIICQGILNDPNLDEISDNEGRSLVLSAKYADYLLKLSSTKVAFILSDLLKDSEFKGKIAEGQFGFLRTDGAFEKCMVIAYNKYGWVKKRLK